MVRIAPVRLACNPKTLWFDARDLDLVTDDAVVVLTARGLEFGHVDEPVFEATHDQVSKLKSPLKPVRRLATDEDIARAEELEVKSREALPIFRQLAAEKAPDMNPVAVEFLFDGDKAVFFFESEDRIDFRDLVRDLASRFRVRVDMKQIGVRDEARMVGGIGHCGQELCCRRLGGEFNPVSIRMAKEQGLSLNPQKISGLCGRLMCCLRYEFDAYKDFHGRAPKKNAKVKTPVGEGKVVDLDVPRETVSILVEDEKPVSVPLADMDTIGDSSRPNAVGEEAWEAAHAAKEEDRLGAASLLTSQLTEKDTLADPTEVRRVGSGKSGKKQSGQNRSGRSRKQQQASEPAPIQHKQRRRRSTKVGVDGTTSTVEAPAIETEAKRPSVKQGQRPNRRQRPAAEKQQEAAAPKRGVSKQNGSKAEGSAPSNGGRTRRRRSSGSGSKGAQVQRSPETRAQNEGQRPTGGAQGSVAPGRKSSALRSREGSSQGQQHAQQSGKGAAQHARPQVSGSAEGAGKPASAQPGRRPRRRRSSSGGNGGNGGNGQGKKPDQGHAPANGQ